MSKNINNLIQALDLNAKERLKLCKAYEKELISFEEFLQRAEKLDMYLQVVQADNQETCVCTIDMDDLDAYRITEGWKSWKN